MNRQEIGGGKFDPVGAGIVEQLDVQALGDQPAGPAFIDRMLPAVRSGVSPARDLADGLFSAKAGYDCRCRFHRQQYFRQSEIPVNSFSDDVAWRGVATNRKYGMNDELRNWIKNGLKKPGKSKSGLAAALGKANSAVTNILSGIRRINVEEIPVIAAYLEDPPPSMPGIDIRPRPELVEVVEGRLVPVTLVGPVQAGAFIPIDEFDQSEPEIFYEPADPDFPRARRTAFDVIGDSMNRLEPTPILPGSRVIGVNYDDIGIPLRDKMVVVVQQERDGGHLREWSVKQIELQDEEIIFHPRSSNPRHKPIVVPRNLNPDDGRQVRILALVREIKNKVPVF